MVLSVLKFVFTLLACKLTFDSPSFCPAQASDGTCEVLTNIGWNVEACRCFRARTPGDIYTAIRPFQDSADLQVAVDAITSGNPTSLDLQVYGATMNAWDVRGVTDMSGLFQNKASFNADISCWDVGGVTEFSAMFQGAVAFNQDIGGWDVGLGTRFNNMFRDAATFNQDISGWDVGMGTDFNNMFRGGAFNQDIGDWNVAKGTNFGNMFRNAAAFNQDIGDWNVAMGTNFGSMFGGATNFNQDISGWDVGMGTDFGSMFNGARAFNQNLCSWGSKIIVPVSVLSMFSSSGCDIQLPDPSFTNTPPGSFCVACTAR